MKFFNVVIKAQTYLNMLYLLLSFPLGIFYFVFLVTGLSLGFGLIITLLGIPILAVMPIAWMGLGFIERWLATLLLPVDIAPLYKPVKGNTWTRYKSFISNPVTWKSLLFLFLKFPLGIFSFVVIVTLTSLSLAFIASPILVVLAKLGTLPQDTFVIGQYTLDHPLLLICIALFGLLMSLLSLHAFNGIAFVNGLLAKLLLGSESNRQKKK